MTRAIMPDNEAFMQENGVDSASGSLVHFPLSKRVFLLFELLRRFHERAQGELGGLFGAYGYVLIGTFRSSEPYGRSLINLAC